MSVAGDKLRLASTPPPASTRSSILDDTLLEADLHDPPSYLTASAAQFVAMSSKGSKDEVLSLETFESALAKDTRIKLAGVDVDGKHIFNMVLFP